jgi:hypothetical protein
MSDHDRLLEILQGNREALDLVLMLQLIVNVWDDLIDRDKPVTDSDINRTFWYCLVGLPTNPFYFKHAYALQPVIQTGILNWFAANHLEHDKEGMGRELAHVLRYSITDVIVQMTYLIGGYEWAGRHAHEIKLMTQTNPLSEYLAEMEAKYDA